MEPLILLLLVLVIGVPIAIIILMVTLHSRVRGLREEVDRLRLRVDLLHQQKATVEPPRPVPVSSSARAVPPAPLPADLPRPTEAVPNSPAPPIARIPTPPRLTDTVSPPLEPVAKEPAWGSGWRGTSGWQGVREWAPINWEQFMGVKLFAWVSGLAFFLGIVFFVKHAFEHSWISPEIRVTLGFLTGLGLAVGGTLLYRRNYQVPAQTLCATGILTLYGTTFACRSVYAFAWFGQVPAFLLMALITVAALVLALRLEALVVAILGLVGGFLTPALLSTGQDNPLGLFSYIALLDLGLLALALHRRWHFLALMAALGTVLLELSWMGEFFVRERYFEGNKILITLAVFAFFSILFGVVWRWGWRQHQFNSLFAAAAIVLPAVGMAVVPYWFGFDPLGQRPGLLFVYVLVIDACLLSLAWSEKRWVVLEPIAGGAVFLLLTLWTASRLSTGLLYWGLGLVFAFALIHAVIPVIRRRFQPGLSAMWWGHLFPLIALFLMLIPVFQLDPIPFGIWPFILLLDLLVVGLAFAWASLVGLIGAAGLTLIVAACWIVNVPPALDQLGAELFVIGAFAIFFMAAGVLISRWPGFAERTTLGPMPVGFGFLEIPRAWIPQVPALSVVLPFTLLILVSQRLPLTGPSALFGLALLLVVLVLGLTRSFGLTWLPMVGLGCIVALEYTWHFGHFDPAHAVTPLAWYAVFIVIFALFPFLFWKNRTGEVLPWTAAALSGPLHFYLVHRLVKVAWPMDYMGILPVLFALPSLAALWVITRRMPPETPGRRALLAWFGGSTLFFVTLIFPIQFDRQWITVGWALEGAALIWLFHRIPHEGLRLAGVGLLVVAFARLAVNPAVLTYHVRREIPILNWYLYAYGLVIASLYLGARWLAPPYHKVLQSDARSILNVLGTILAFLLLNIQIADYFTTAGVQALTFEFSGDFGRDMTYSIAWAAFALGLLTVGIRRRLVPARYAAMALFIVTLLKLFFHDLSRLGQLYRIGAFLGVAIIAMLASFLYQRYFMGNPDLNENVPRNLRPE